MRKYVSLGAAMMMGVVVSKKPSLSYSHGISHNETPKDVREAVKNSHLERPTKIPKNERRNDSFDIIDKERRRS
jgi:hypothetical protein